jgi:hypothetical protein
MLMAGWGMQRQRFGEQKHWMIVAGGNVGANRHTRRRFEMLLIICQWW